jgi:hypothetical protein
MHPLTQPGTRSAPPRLQLYAVIAATALLLLWSALLNGFPLVFPDTGTYMRVAFGEGWPIDRSGFYGFAMKPFLVTLPGASGLWIWTCVQAALIAAALVLAMRRIAPHAPIQLQFACLAAVALLTSLPWHSAQLMPDAFTGPLVLLTWLACSHDPSEPEGSPYWYAVAAAGLVHVTHVGLVAMAAAGSLIGYALAGLPLRALGHRALAALLAILFVLGTQVAVNGLLFGRWTISPAGPAFLFARLNEDGLIPRWMDRHCGVDAPAALCQLRPSLPRDSQKLLWSDQSPLHSRLWDPPEGADPWALVDMMSQANAGALAEEPLAFLGNAARAGWHQFVRFRGMDDECPEVCGREDAALVDALRDHRPKLLPALLASDQLRGTSPDALVRAVTTPIAGLSLLLLLLCLFFAWRRRDAAALSLLLALGAALIGNAAMAGALSDVHDRYQSRLVWLALFILLALVLRWRSVSEEALPRS